MDLRCRKTECAFNNKYTCMAKSIKINDKIICSTYQKTDKSEPDTSKFLFDRAPEYAPQRESKTCCIGCDAKCLFNKEHKCVANGITVNSIAEKPYCVTYLGSFPEKDKKAK